MVFPWWTFRIFFIFSARGGEWGSPRRQEGAGIVFYLKIPGGGGAGRVSAANWGIFGGGANFFFFGAETSTKFQKTRKIKITF